MPDLKDQAKGLPDKPGVYLFKDQKGTIIYVGKSNEIKKRVASHLRGSIAAKIHKISHIRTNSEADALILEARLIKRYKPKFNVSMRDDKQYPYIKVTNEEYPRIIIARKKEHDGARYYGRFMSGSARALISLTSKVFKIRRCRQSPLKDKNQPCLDYYIKRCKGPCVGEVSKAEYKRSVAEAESVFKDGISGTLEKLSVLMQKASEKQNYENAAEIRNKILWLKKAEDQIFGKKKEAYYDLAAIRELKDVLQLAELPKRIECFDISNLSSSATVASMVVFEMGLPHKKHYRKFKICYEHTPNDVASIYEVVYRRYAKSLSKTLPKPDLIVIDGGAGQLASAQKALIDAKEADIPVIGLAKRVEEIYYKIFPKPLILSRSSKALRLLQRIRDEAHRFAVSYHRKRRNMEFMVK